MNLSTILFNAVIDKLKLETLRTEEDIYYSKQLLKKTGKLQKERSAILISNEGNTRNSKTLIQDDFSVMYVFSISFLKTNTVVHVSDVKGKIRFFYTAGCLNFSGKQKRQRNLTVFKLISLILKKAQFLKSKPIALHFNNVSVHKAFIIKKLKRRLFIKLIKSFNQPSYNGCRKKKMRRKKHGKKLVK